jgi:hypothetical protein
VWRHGCEREEVVRRVHGGGRSSRRCRGVGGGMVGVWCGVCRERKVVV